MIRKPQSPLVLIFTLATAHGQTTQGLISRRMVSSQTGLPIPAALVTFTSATTNTTGAARSDSSGYYALSLLPPGVYRLHADTLQPQEVQEIVLPVAGRVDLDLRLHPFTDVWEAGQFRNVFLPGSKTIVTFYGPDVDTSHSSFVAAPRTATGTLKSTVSTVIDPAQVRDLPLAGRDVYTMLIAQPGVTADTTTARGRSLALES